MVSQCGDWSQGPCEGLKATKIEKNYTSSKRNSAVPLATPAFWWTTSLSCGTMATRHFPVVFDVTHTLLKEAVHSFSCWGNWEFRDKPSGPHYSIHWHQCSQTSLAKTTLFDERVGSHNMSKTRAVKDLLIFLLVFALFSSLVSQLSPSHFNLQRRNKTKKISATT